MPHRTLKHFPSRQQHSRSVWSDRYRSKRPQSRLVNKLFKLLGCFLLGLSVILYNLPGQAAVVPFGIRFQTNDTGDIVFVANTLMTCPSSANGCASAQAGTSTSGQNNTFNMAYIDIDSDSTTINSSSAQLNLPSGSTVLFAGLYWGGDSSSASRNQVKLATPGSGSYTSITANSSDIYRDIGYQNAYQGFANITNLVRAAGNGTYTVANVQSTTGVTNRWAGWTIVVAYRDLNDKPRNLTVFDGFNVVSTANTTIDITVSGFRTPPFGAVSAKLGAVVYDGDDGGGGANTFTGDRFKLNGTDLSNAANPANDAFNSSISYLGTQITSKNPNYKNQLGFDADIFSANGLIANNATSATLTLNTGGETFMPGVVTSSIDLYAPVLDIQKSVVDINGGNVEIGDILEYTITTTNNKDTNGNGDPANNNVLRDPIPTNTTYVPGSLRITAGPNSSTKTDAAGDDQAEYDAAGRQVIYRLGTGASATTGGTLSVNTGTTASPSAGSTTTLKFQVKVDASTPNGTLLINQAQETYTGQTLGTGTTLVGNSTASSVTVNTVPKADLSITKTDNRTTVAVGSPTSYQITVTNAGPNTLNSLTVTDVLPTTFQNPVFTPSTGTYNASTGVWTGLTLASGQSITLTISGTVALSATGTITNTAIAAVPSGFTDPISTNNTASDTTKVYAVSSQRVIINEVLYRQSGAATAAENDEFIELYNASSTSVDMGGWQLSDGNLIEGSTDGTGSITGSATNPAYVFPSGTSLGSGQYAVIWIGANNANNQASGAAFQAWLNQPPNLNNAGDDVWLYDSQLRIVDYIAYGSDSAVNTPPPDSLNLWNATYQTSLASASLGQSISLTPNGQDGNTSACWEPSTSEQARGRCAGYLSTRDVDTVGIRVTSVGQSNNDVVAMPPQLLLVKRITAINGVAVNTYVDDTYDNPATPQNEAIADNAAKWPVPIDSNSGISTYLRGATNGGQVRPGDEIEYTIYFLSNGGTPLTNASLCDLVPANSTFIPNSFSSSSGIDLAVGSAVSHLTNAPDIDNGEYVASNTTPSVSCSATNTNGAIVVRIVRSPETLPAAVGAPGYGYVRFRARVN